MTALKKQLKEELKSKYINRELSWLKFNERVLLEAQDLDNPLYERVKFLSIAGSNLDEFFMVRVAGLYSQIKQDVDSLSSDGLTPDEQMAEVIVETKNLLNKQNKIYTDLISRLKKNNISLIKPENLKKSDQKKLLQTFNEEIYPLLTPSAIDPAHPFPFIANQGRALVMKLKKKNKKRVLNSIIVIPKALPRFIEIERGKNFMKYVIIDDVISFFASAIFPDHNLEKKMMFRVIRDSDVEIQEEAEDLVRSFELALKRRRTGDIVRLEILKNSNKELVKFIVNKLKVNQDYIYEIEGLVGIQDIDQICKIKNPKLRFKHFNPREVDRLKEFNNNFFDTIKKKDLIVHHPFETFDAVIEFLSQAAYDKKVIAIKQTLYRTTLDSPIVKALISAAENGKTVTALIEIKARFDEEANIQLSRSLEKAGVQIVYGFAKYKTHAKSSLILRREKGKIQTYIHLGTGNYHPVNAKIYTDLSLFSSDKKLASDVEKFFNYVTGYAKPRNLNKISISPVNLRNTLNSNIDREISNAKKGKKAEIWAKMNSLVDPLIIDKLYEASNAGVIGDWENYYSTMSYDAEAQIVRELGKFLKEGSLYRGFKPVLWSTVEKTALADAEVEYQDHKSDTIYTSFPVKSSNLKELEGSEIIIWTTTPWTIPANKALAYNEALDYVLIHLNDDGDFKDRKIVIAQALLDSVLKECSINDYKEIKKFKGKDFKDTICNHPFFNLGYEYDIPMLEARFVTTEQGTGIVHCAPSHGPDDFNLCLNHGIKAIETVDGDGKYTKNVHLFEGNHIFKANPIVIEKLKEQKKLLANGELTHSYPHSWRSKAPLVHRATPQWFISMESHKLRETALKALDETTFYPSKGKERLKSMIETRPDWCVSRQRVWGVPLPIFVNKKTKEILVDDEVNENIANIYEKEGSDCWFSDNPQKFLGEKYKSEDYEKLSDIVEVWFDSGSTHSFVLEKREDLKWPASMYLEGSDQHRGWFHSSLLESCGTRGKAPFESILSHGFVVDGKGLKMSKSLGNVIAPEDILKKYGADILRIWVASSNYAEDLRIDHSILDQHADSYRKIRNTFRYLLGNLNDNFEEIDLEKINLSELPELEQFMLHKIYSLNENFKNYFNNYDFHNLYKELLNFCTVDLSAFYFDIRKDSLYCDSKDSKKRKSTIILLNVILNSLLKWFAPILCFTTEEIYKLIMNDNKSIHLTKFLEFPKNFKNENLNQKWLELIKIRNVCNISIEEKRASKEIGSSLEASLKINLDKKLNEISKDVNFSELCITSSAEVSYLESSETNVQTTKAEGSKCQVCWKITKDACSRKTCPQQTE